MAVFEQLLPRDTRRDPTFPRLRGSHLSRSLGVRRQKCLRMSGTSVSSVLETLSRGDSASREGGCALPIFCCRRRRKDVYEENPDRVPRSCKSSPDRRCRAPHFFGTKTFLLVEPAGLSCPEPPKTGDELDEILQPFHPFGSLDGQGHTGEDRTAVLGAVL
ncbi:hypothetical protein H1C71_007283 [Ictidomys tridecemlineatus]|nr:hypothetical protein H1C71_007283 [Ictidomys tridecemlineatus]KAG3280326.1 hypothetical protein H1C71_007283 [Ictidomys tridecemlineatus]KAG3280327.1 hypothetical protein H1C71_007283 [Ictidomys tridecemlineatus]KAG3280328.1 hypothetical protein H1C71_007283 [Ictidomys tridecemlineatus]